MPVLQSVRDYARKHRNGILAVAVLSGGAYLASRYAKGQLLEGQKRATAESEMKQNLKKRFQQNQNDCVFTVLSLLPTLGDQILDEMNVEASWAKLQESRKREKQQQDEHDNNNNEPTGAEQHVEKGILDKDEKYQLWEEIKVKSFSRTLTTLYSVALLSLLTHLQLDLLGRFAYVWTVSMADKREPTMQFQQQQQQEDEYGNKDSFGPVDPQTEQMFLSTSWWLLHRGWRTYAKHVQKAVDDVIGSFPLKRMISQHDAHVIVGKLRKQIEDPQDGSKPRLSSYVFPNNNEAVREMLFEMGFANASPQALAKLKRLMDAARSYMNSPEFDRLYSACLDRVFNIFHQHAFGTGNDTDAKRVTMANVLPAISRQAHRIIAGSEYLNELAYCKEVEDFSAMINKQYSDPADRN